MNSGSQESNLRFIKEVRKRSCLYDKTSMGYSRKSVQDKAWEEVAQIMEWKADFCRERWRNLRCVYTRHLKKKNKGVCKRPYYLMNAMRFALPFIKSLHEQPLCREILEENNDIKDEVDYDEIQQFQESLSPTQISISRTPSPEANRAYEAAYLTSQRSQIKTEARSYSSDSRNSNNNNPGAMTDAFGNVSTNDIKVEISEVNPNLDLQNDAKKMFLLSLLPDVYAMSDIQMRTFKRGVLDIIGNIFDSGESSQK